MLKSVDMDHCKTFLFLLLVSIFTFISVTFAEAQKLEVYKDQYVYLKTEFVLRSFLLGDEAVLGPDKAIIDESDDLLLVTKKTPGLQLRSISQPVPTEVYDASRDLCVTNPVPGYSCSPNFLIKLDVPGAAVAAGVVASNAARLAQAQAKEKRFNANNLPPNDPKYGELWGLHQPNGINADRAWEKVNPNKSVRVAVIDSGVDCMHEDLSDSCEVQYDAIKDIVGIQFDENGHGTHVAGTILASGNNGVGVTGVVWNAHLIAIKFLNKDGSGSIFNAIRGIRFAIDQQAQIINASWGGGGYSEPMDLVLKEAEQRGIIFVAAAGNNGVNTDDKPHYPSSYEHSNILSVASIDVTGKKSSFSNFGLTSVDIAAPGRSILSTWTGGKYKSISGTSMAAPHVSGVLALMGGGNIQHLFDTGRKNEHLSQYVRTGSVADAMRYIESDPDIPCDKEQLKYCRKECGQLYVCKYFKQRRCRKQCKVDICPETQ